MKKGIGLVLAFCLAAAFAACATLTGGQTDPFLSKLVPGTLSDYGPTLLGQSAGSCNVGACKEYNVNMVICENPNAFVGQLPGNPFATTAQLTGAITAVCNTNGYVAGAPPQ